MSLLGNLLIALAKVLNLIGNLYTFIVAGAVIVSWVRPDPYNPIVVFLYQATDPIFRRVRRFMPRFLFASSIDWTPLIVVIVIIFIQTILVGTLEDLGHNLRVDRPAP